MLLLLQQKNLASHFCELHMQVVCSSEKREFLRPIFEICSVCFQAKYLRASAIINTSIGMLSGISETNVAYVATAVMAILA